jgi:hypothetical protein
VSGLWRRCFTRLMAILNLLVAPYVVARFPREARRYLRGTLLALWRGTSDTFACRETTDDAVDSITIRLLEATKCGYDDGYRVGWQDAMRQEHPPGLLARERSWLPELPPDDVFALARFVLDSLPAIEELERQRRAWEEALIDLNGGMLAALDPDDYVDAWLAAFPDGQPDFIIEALARSAA